MRPIDIIRGKLRRRTLTVLGEHGVSLIEYHVMIVVGYGIVVKPDELASFSAQESEGDPRGEFPILEYCKAVDQCIEKRWLALLTPEECEREAERRQSAWLPDLTDTCLSPGTVDFTPEGYLLYRKLTLEINGKEHLQFNDSGWNLDEECKEVHILAETEEMCRRRIEEFVDNPSSHIGLGGVHLPAQVINVSGPTPIGPWRPNRFIIIPNGFNAKIEYEVLSAP